MKYEVHESAKALPRATMNTIWYLWELYGKDHAESTFELSRGEEKQVIRIMGTEHSHSFAMSPSVQGRVVIVKTGNTAAMHFLQP